MKKNDWFILKKYSQNLKLHPYHLEIIMRSLEFYLLVVRQQYHDNLISTSQYDDLYFEIYCLYNSFMYNLSNIPNSYRPLTLELYKRIDNREKIDSTLKRFKIA